MFYKIAKAIFYAVSILASATPTNAQAHPTTINLSKLGYPTPPCNFMFFDGVGRPKKQIEFLDAQHLIVSFPLSKACSQRLDDIRFIPAEKAMVNFPHRDQTFAETFRTVVIDTAGNSLQTLDWKFGENVQAGPQGHILFSTSKQIRILNPDFTIEQTIPWTREKNSYIQLTPLRDGFSTYGRSSAYVTLFHGIPAQQISSGGKLTYSQNSEPLGEMNDLSYFESGGQVYSRSRSGQKTDITNLQWLDEGYREDLGGHEFAVGTTPRLLAYMYGTVHPFLLGKKGIRLRVLAVDLTSKQILLQKKFAYDSEATISPDGHMIAVREGEHLMLFPLP